MRGLPDLNELEAKARVAQEAGLGEDKYWYEPDELLGYLPSISWTAPTDAPFIAACSPDVVLALIDRMRDKERQLYQAVERSIEADRLLAKANNFFLGSPYAGDKTNGHARERGDGREAKVARQIRLYLKRRATETRKRAKGEQEQHGA